jgi:hypothetical protein
MEDEKIGIVVDNQLECQVLECGTPEEPTPGTHIAFLPFGDNRVAVWLCKDHAEKAAGLGYEINSVDEAAREIATAIKNIEDGHSELPS